MKFKNPYRPTSIENGHSKSKPVPAVDHGAALARLPASILLVVGMDFLIGIGFGFVFLAGVANGGFHDHWASVAFAALLLLISGAFVATTIGLLSRLGIGWWLAIVSHCLLAVFVLSLYAILAYILIDTWGVSSHMWTGGDAVSMTIVTATFIVVEFAASLPLFLLCRKSTRELYAST